MNEGKVYEVTLNFNEKLNEKELETYLQEQFNGYYLKDGSSVVVLFYVEYDKNTDYEDQLSISIGHVMKAGEYGTSSNIKEI